METPVVTITETGILQNEDGNEIENAESTPSAAWQEVNKPKEEAFDLDKNVDTENDNENVNAKADQLGASPKKPLKRNVSFPPESPVTGCLEPPDPWKNVPNWKTDDLLRAYKLGCEKHGTKPLNKIVQQLTCIENVGERYEILSLKGERLDIRQCESLEEIFKHVRFRCIDLEATHLDDETSVAIFDMVEYYESACKLNISFNKNIGPRGWQACSKLIRKTPCLTFVDAKNCDLNERVMPILGRSLRMGCFLTRLHLQGVGLAGRALVILVAALKMNETLKELFIGDNKLMSTDGVQIGNLLKFNHKLELLDLRNNHLQDVGIHHVCEGLSEQTYDSGLLTLVLWNNQISFQAMSDISQALTKTENLETLNLGHNPITNEGIHLMKDGLLKSKSLLKLGLSGTKVTCEGAVALAEVIADASRLVRLDLQENDIKTAGLMALSLALKVNKSLSRLDLDKETKKEQGIKDYAEQQRRLQQDIKTYLERNRDLANKQLKEQETVTKVENTSSQKDKVKVQIGKSPEADFDERENNGNNGEATCEEKNLTSVEASYIPTVDKISRPKLLFLPERCPESDLESPPCGTGNYSILQPHPEMVSLTLPSPLAQDLLSPQYLPKMKAKKLFSVTRVTSPTFAPPTNPLLDTKNASLPVPHLCTPLSSVPVGNPLVPSLTIETLNLDTSSQVEVGSCLIQHKLECETLESYLQDIVDANKCLLEPGVKIDKLYDRVKMQETGSANAESNSTELDSNVDNSENNFEELTTNKVVKTIETKEHASKLNVDKVRAENDLCEPLQDDWLEENDSCFGVSVSTTDTNIESAIEVSAKTESEMNRPSNFDNSDGAVSENIPDLCVKNSALIETRAEASVNGSELVKAPVNETENLSAQGAGDLVVDNVILQSEYSSLSKMANIIPDGPVSDDSNLVKIKGMTDTDSVLSTDGASDDQLDSIEIVPVSDINEIKCVSDFNEEPPELLDCDTNDDISNNAYLGLTDSLCDLVLPFELENNNTTNVANVDVESENMLQKDNANALPETKTASLNSENNGHHLDSGTVENETEQWNKVEKSDVCDRDYNNSSSGTKSVNKPDFHTSLSLNGLKQELANLIDEDGNITRNGSQTILKTAIIPEDIIPVHNAKDDNLAENSGDMNAIQTNGQ